MKCSKCGSECPDDNIFCEACGAELDAPVLPDNIDEKGRINTGKKSSHKKKASASESKPKKEKKAPSPEQRAASMKKLKGLLAVIAVIAVIVIVVIIWRIIGSNKGFSDAQKIPLGRNVEYAEAETGLEFSPQCSNGLINSMADFDYIYTSEETTKVNGSVQPQWVIMLTLDEADRISEVEYYDFRQISRSWKGSMSTEMLTADTLEYGMSVRNVNKMLGLKPYYVKRSVSNDSVYCYRYYYTDHEAGYDKVYNYYVDFSAVELAVRNVHYSEISYARTILNAGDTSVAPEEAAGNDDSSDDGESSQDEAFQDSDGLEVTGEEISD